jgi:hypothetical protein
MKRVASAIFITAAFIARSEGLEQFSKRRDGGCDDGNGGLGSSPDYDVTTII